MMEKWLESVYSDGTAQFVSSPAPSLEETVSISVRMYESAPVRHVVLRLLRNGAEELVSMHKDSVRNGLVYYKADIQIRETRTPYHFNLICDNKVYFYNQKEITTYMPNPVYDFVLLTDYVQPAWVKEAVFYQIFPERFCNGDPTNDVKNGEYSQFGHPAICRENWNDVPLDYHEGYCLDFHGGDLQGIQQKIPYLKKLGVTALYLNPIFSAPSVHKYDCIDYFHVDAHFGGDEALAELSRALHENGMRLILDISINHTGVDHKWFNKDCEWFPAEQGAYHNPESIERGYYFFEENNNYKSWWDVPTLPTLNYTSEALRDVIYRSSDSVLKKWLRPPYSIDGWRFDVADVFARQDRLQLSHTLWPEIRKSIRKENPQAYILAEDWGDCWDHLQGDEWDAPMNYYGCGRLIRQFFGEPERFMANKGLLDGLHVRLSGEDLRETVLDYLSKLPQPIRDNQFNLFDSHDLSRLHNNPILSWDAYRGAVIFQFILPGAPSIYYGDEAEIDGRLGSNEGCRYPMPWDKDIEHTRAYSLYSTLAHLKSQHKALSSGGMKFLYAKDQVISIARFDDTEAFVSVISADEKETHIRLPLGILGKQKPKENADLFGNVLLYVPLCDGSIELTVPPKTAYLFLCK